MRIVIATSVAILLSASLAWSTPMPTSDLPIFARVHGKSAPPYGYVQFCSSRPKLCKGDGRIQSRVKATEIRMQELDRVNRQVNKAIKPVEDKQQYGVEEYWTIPTSGMGDCEEYVLVKRQKLIDNNWPTGALLITVVLDEKRQGHAVLTARTSSGDIILDNKHDDIKLWSKTPYTYIMRQSYLNPNVWLSMAPAGKESSSPTAGTPKGSWSAVIRQR